MEVLCDKFGNKIAIDEYLYTSGKSQTVCCPCGNNFIVKKENGRIDTVFNAAKITGKIAYKIIKSAYDLFLNEADKFRETQEDLEKRGLNDWSEEELKKIFYRSTTSMMEKSIIGNRLKEIEAEKQSKKHNSSMRRDG